MSPRILQTCVVVNGASMLTMDRFLSEHPFSDVHHMSRSGVQIRGDSGSNICVAVKRFCKIAILFLPTQQWMNQDLYVYCFCSQSLE